MNPQQIEIDAIANELFKLEKALLDPMVRHNHQRMSALLAEDFIEFGSSGRVWTRETTLEHLAAEDSAYIRPEIEKFSCRMLANGVALVTYRALKQRAEEESREVSLRCSIWTKNSGNWRMRFHQGTRAQ